MYKEPDLSDQFHLCSHFKSVIYIGPFKISTDHYHAVMDSALCVYKTARVVGSRRVTRAWKQQNASRYENAKK